MIRLTDKERIDIVFGLGTISTVLEGFISGASTNSVQIKEATQIIDNIVSLLTVEEPNAKP